MDTTMIIGIVVLVALVIAAVVAAVLVDRSHKRRATGAHDDSPSRTRSAQQPETAVPAASAPQQATTESAVNPTAQSASPAPAERPVETPESAGSRIVRLKAKLAKSSNPFGRALFNILAKDHLSETDWEDVEDTLLLADVGADASAQLVEELRNDARVTGASDPEQVRDALRSKLLDLVGTDTDRRLNADKNTANPDAAQPESPQPSVIIMVGVNGTGKTTTAGKLARLFVAEDKKVVMGAADTFRAAAADQLETWGAKVGVSVVRSDKDGADPASVAFDAAQQAKDANADVLIIDTAGRLQNKANLMKELGKIRRVAEKVLPVDEVLLVLDATTGQNGMAQAKVFAEAIGITGVVLSKLDGSAKGGIVIAVQKELGVPVKLVGLGEGPDDLAPFDAAAFVDGILA
ncbi:MAG: signal recognition particle-docking protein FtsY [Bifidobacterium tibiigranuli]|uniref:signal recognition particle-docking protein FtsY n=1 Tax=Bifidobacterium tibiigranuli TaxID=2172043 RepID=UPI0026EDAAF3|nr:signal recognition particle-docking protein FtsY [Bifidobacterium tibiigranuli]MCI1672879.1 signal recognition particle-docking protein FtsY [Bifidobacterium tibiigranuli]MCI1713718.1 signal recognition particle-docking protein FtsY [Bifidobacterium tibiigranuli]MCI1833990.1 signal recognition particle-docking protein FtsY [Bifidobacterium tibiigranuli]